MFASKITARSARIEWHLVAIALLLGGAAEVFAQAPTIPNSTRESAESRPYLQAYPVPAKASAQAQQWAAKFPASEAQRVAYDARTNQLLVMGDDGLHRFVADMLTRAAKVVAAAPAVAGAPAAGDDAILPLPNQPAATTANRPPAQPAATTTVVAGAVTLDLDNMAGGELHRRLEKVLGKPLPLSSDSARGTYRFLAELVPTRGVAIEMHPQSRRVNLIGEQGQLQAWQRVIKAMDVGASAKEGDVTQVLAAKTTPKPTLKRTLALLGSAGKETDGNTTLVMQQGDGQPSGEATLPQPPATAGETNEGESAGDDTALLGPVQIEFVEGLDIIIVRGNDRDVQKVMRIIEDIENLSAVTVPTIEVLPMQHVESKAMAALLERVYDEVLGPRTGSVSITPLVKPNSLLLIGRDENVKTAVDLVKRIDKPVEPTTRFELFPLKHASAAEAKALIDEFLESEDEEAQDDELPTLAPKALVVADSRTNSLVVSAGPRDMAEIAEIVRRIDVERGEAIDQLRVFKLKHTLAAEIADTIRAAITGDEETGGGDDEAARQSALTLVNIDPTGEMKIDSGVLSSVRISADERNNSLVVTAPAASMELIAALIGQLDRVPEAKAELKVFTVANGDAVALQEMLENLFGLDEDDDEVGSIGASENPLIRLQLSVDERTNSIIAAGTADDLSVVEALLQTLDASDTLERETKVYRLKNSFAVDVATSLNEWLASERDAEANAELAISPVQQIQREVIIVADQATNSLIVGSTPRYYDKIAKIIAQLDERPPMVNIQVLIAEVRLNDTDEFGVELGLQDSLLFDRSLISSTQNSQFQTISSSETLTNAGGATIGTLNTETIINAPLSPGFNFLDPSTPLGNNASTAALATAGNVATQALSSFGVNRVNSELGFGGFVFSASSSSVNMLLRALQENRRLEVLTRPQIVALDNQPGEILVGERVPTITQVNTTNFGQNNSVVYEPAGIVLRVTPRINDDGLVVMTVYAEKSAVGDPDEGIPVFAGNDGTVVNAPRINQIVAQTTVASLSGQTVVLSGLLTKETADIHRRVPMISDIPLIGDLFRYDAVSEERSELLIILTPRVMRNELDAEMIKQVESSRMSWVLCDVVDLHGPSGLKSRCDDWSTETEAIYPNYVPTEAELISPAEESYEIQPQQGPIQQGPVQHGPVQQGPVWIPEASTAPQAIPAARNGQVVPTSYQAPATTRSSIPVRLPPVSRSQSNYGY